jgi:carboxyl-terminal processing protease
MTKQVRLFLISVSSIVVFYVLLGAVLGQTTSNNDKTYRDLGVYSEVLSRIQQEYVTQPNLNKVTDGAIRGLLEALDPYSTYFSPKEYQDYLDHPDPGPGKVGIYLSKRSGFATVVAVLPGSPAAKAGIQSGDLLDSVEGMPVREFSVVQLERNLGGPVGTTVTIGIVHEARGDPKKITLTREMLDYPPPEAKTIDDHTAYVKVLTFNKGMADQISSKLKELISGGDSKVVLDLRSCAGGDVAEAEKTANLFLDHGLITYLEGQRFPRKDFEAQASDQIVKLPVVVLINQATSGPAEIVAGGLQGNQRAQVVGTRSFGVGVYQKLVPVGDGSALLLSVAKYFTPAGKEIQGKGITPDVVEEQESQTASLGEVTTPGQPASSGSASDPQLEKALEVLRQLRASASRPNVG